jgi:hypothetical protein
LPDAGLGLEALELRLEALERLRRPAAPEQREHVAAARILEAERSAAVQRECAEPKADAAGDLVELVAAADLVDAGQDLARHRGEQQQREERLAERRQQREKKDRSAEAEQVDARRDADLTRRRRELPPSERQP